MNTTSGDFPYIYIWAGVASDGNTNISQSMFWGSTTPVGIVTNSSVTSGSALWESDFSGASGRFCMLLWRGYNAQAATPTTILIIDRSKDNNGNDTDAYWTIIWYSANSVNGSVSIFKAGTGGTSALEVNQSTGTVLHTINTSTTTLSINNSVCILPIFPLVGFVGNPLLGAISMRTGDVAEGAILSATLYGTTHSYLLSKVGNTTSGGPANFGPGTGVGGCGIRWE